MVVLIILAVLILIGTLLNGFFVSLVWCDIHDLEKVAKEYRESKSEDKRKSISEFNTDEITNEINRRIKEA